MKSIFSNAPQDCDPIRIIDPSCTLPASRVFDRAMAHLASFSTVNKPQLLAVAGYSELPLINPLSQEAVFSEDILVTVRRSAIKTIMADNGFADEGKDRVLAYTNLPNSVPGSGVIGSLESSPYIADSSVSFGGDAGVQPILGWVLKIRWSSASLTSSVRIFYRVSSDTRITTISPNNDDCYEAYVFVPVFQGFPISTPEGIALLQDSDTGSKSSILKFSVFDSNGAAATSLLGWSVAAAPVYATEMNVIRTL